MERWTDGRTGDRGCYLGDLVLDSLDPNGSAISRVKGTVFEGKDAILVGRMVADDYLEGASLHWANVGRSQHFGLQGLAASRKKKLLYLFVSWLPKTSSVRYWLVPDKLIEKAMNERRKDSASDVLSLYIRQAGSRELIESFDVTDFGVTLKLTTLQIATLEGLRSSGVGPSQKFNHGNPEVDAKVAGRGFTEFQIPMAGGRILMLSAELPLARVDIDRLKGWIDLNSDLLT